MTKRMTKQEAQKILDDCEIDSSVDFHALYSGNVARLGVAARRRGYNKPTNANGSTSRCFHAYIMRTLGK